jgi:hypothetical protein
MIKIKLHLFSLLLLLAMPYMSLAFEVPGPTLYCNIDKQGGVFFFDARGAQYLKYGSSYSTNCITPALEEIKFHCFNMPSAYAVEKMEIVATVNGFLTQEQKFKAKTVSMCEALPESRDAWDRSYMTNLPITLRKLDDASYSSATRKGTFFVFMAKELAYSK